MELKKVIWPAILYVTVSGISIAFSTTLNQAEMKKLFGIFLILLSVYYLFFNKNQKKLNFVVSVIFIAISGIRDGLLGMGGPLMVCSFWDRPAVKRNIWNQFRQHSW